ncbi:MAG TPA: hypothetical protein VN873_13705 [Candidatus Angelobacter sp.]|nr:hypothetical protein [Candidatus Angelobacter sp.]
MFLIDHETPVDLLYYDAIAETLVKRLPSARAASPDEEAKFVEAAKQAFEKHDANALAALTCWDRVPNKLRTSGKEQYVRDVAQTIIDITLTNPDPNYPDIVWKDTDGVSYRSNLPVVKQLKITFKTGQFGDGRYPIGEKNGKLYLSEPAPVK